MDAAGRAGCRRAPRPRRPDASHAGVRRRSVCSRAISTSPGESVGAITRSARIAHVESKVPRMACRPIALQSSFASIEIVLPSVAVRCRTDAPGNLRVPRSLASSSNASMPAFAGVSCRAPPRRYRLAAITSFAVLRRRITVTPSTSNLVVTAVSGAAAARRPRVRRWPRGSRDGHRRSGEQHRGEQWAASLHCTAPGVASSASVSFSARRVSGDSTTPVTRGLPTMYFDAYARRSSGVWLRHGVHVAEEVVDARHGPPESQLVRRSPRRARGSPSMPTMRVRFTPSTASVVM